MADNNLAGDPSGWIHLIAGGFLAAAGRWVWQKLTKVTRPTPPAAEQLHSNAYILKKLIQINDKQDQQLAMIEDLQERMERIEMQPRRPAPSTAGD